MKPLLSLSAAAALFYFSPQSPAAIAGIALGALLALVLAIAARPVQQ